MSERESFVKKFDDLLLEIPRDYGLEEWQLAYREVIFRMGMKILDKFPADAVGRDRRREDKSAGGGQGPGGHPSFLNCGGFLDFAAFVLGLQVLRARRKARPSASR